MQAENLLSEGRSQDAAKAQSWMQDHEYTRIAFSNEMSNTGTGKLDGEIIKRLCSNGDVIEVRKNYKDEIQIRLQMSMFLFANDMPSIDPPDAYPTMLGFQFLSEYVSKLYGLKSNKPSKIVDGNKKQDRGFTHLRLFYNGHDERAERLKRNEVVKQGVRSGTVVTHDRHTSDVRLFDSGSSAS